MLLSFAVAVILLLSNFNLAGSVGVQIKWFMFGLFGVMEYIFPIVVAASLIFLISNREYIAVARIKTAAVYILMVLLSAMALRIGNQQDIAESTLMEIFHYSAVHNTGGGFFGGMLCKLLKPLGMFGGMVVLLLLYHHLPDCDYGKIIYQRCDENAEKRKQNGACRKAGLRFVPGTFGRQTEKKAG